MPWFDDIFGEHLRLLTEKCDASLLEYLRGLRAVEPERCTLPIYMTDEEFLSEYRMSHYPKSTIVFMDDLIEKATGTKIAPDRCNMIHLIFPRQCGRTTLYDYLNGSSTIES